MNYYSNPSFMLTIPNPDKTHSRPQLYHYTDARGFLGMLDYKALWFSHLEYMNDSEEWSYAIHLLNEISEEYGSIPHLKDAVDTISIAKSLQNHYSFSLSEEKDLLSQWRGYCPHGGYSFSFDDWHLDRMVDKYKLTFEPCVYEKAAQREFITKRVIGITPEAVRAGYELEKEQSESGRHVSSRGMSERLQFAAKTAISNCYLLAFIKHPSFSEEREWRIIASENRLTDFHSYLKYRESRNMVLPYLSLNIPQYAGSIPNGENSFLEISLEKPILHINEVIVGPSVHQKLALASCRMMMPKYLCGFQQITSSAIPYRNW